MSAIGQSAEPTSPPLSADPPEAIEALIERRWKARGCLGRNGETMISPLVFHRAGISRLNYNKRWREGG